jgi:hypothetical protein
MNSKTAPPPFPTGVMSDCMGAVHILRRSGQHSTVAPCVFTAGPCCLDRFWRGDRKKSILRVGPIRWAWISCTEQNDLQVRYGTRYLLKVSHETNDGWMNYRLPSRPDRCEP